ncbi:MAG: TIGR03862 family flavoprotein [Fluviicola sp.]|nr:TIGR03862 family flavoprotein [Fluviicola sp.]
MSNKIIHIIGTGPAALMAGTQLAIKGYEIHFYDQKLAPARKFLVAGHGGFNLTHSENIELFIQKYNHPQIQNAVKEYTNKDFISFLKSIGIETYTGSSGKIFPIKCVKPIQVLQAWVDYLKSFKCQFHFNYKLIDFDDNKLIFINGEDKIEVNYEKVIFALGGASWKKTGSTGEWIENFKSKMILCNDFEASNSGFEIENWENNSDLAGSIFKNCKVTLNEIEKLGEIVLTDYGIEGSPIYFLNKEYRNHPDQEISIDLKPSKTVEEIQLNLENAKNHSEGLKILNFSKSTQQFIKRNTNKDVFSSSQQLSAFIKSIQLKIKSLRPIDEVISTVGGVSFEELNSDFSLKKNPNIYICGEMLDWDAPTGGYLIQGCVSSGFIVGNNIN